MTAKESTVDPCFVECEDCSKWYDPDKTPGITISRGSFDYTICPNCAVLAGVTKCVECDKAFEESDLHDLGGDMYCNDCACESGWSCCESCSEWVGGDDIRNCNDDFLCIDCALRAGWSNCTSCDGWMNSADSYVSPDNNDSYCCDCFWEIYTCCDGCNADIHRDDASYDDSGTYCSGCAPRGDNFDWAGFKDQSGCTTIIGSERCFGLELETNECEYYDDLNGSAAWGAKDDSTIHGKEFVSDILSGDAGLAAVAEVTDLAIANRWDAGSNCGYHLHLDMRAENDDSLFAAAHAYFITGTLWRSFVNSSRYTNSMCSTVDWDSDDIADFVDHGGSFRNFCFAHVMDRTVWINLRAYDKHKTFEVRNHHGTLDKEAICNWVKAHTRFVDWVCTVGLAKVRESLDGKPDTEMFNFIVNEVWRDKDLGVYYAERSDRQDFAATLALTHAAA